MYSFITFCYNMGIGPSLKQTDGTVRRRRRYKEDELLSALCTCQFYVGSLWPLVLRILLWFAKES